MGKGQRKETEKRETDSGREFSRISVRTFVEFLLRSGDLDNRAQRGSDVEAALAGARIHRKLQKSQKDTYSSEVSLQLDTEYEDLVIRVEGRADGIFEADGAVKGEIPEEYADCRYWIDEIKGMYLDVTALEEPFPLHLAQAKCYAAIYARQEELPVIGVRMTYVQLDSEEIKYFYRVFSTPEITEWFDDLIRQWHRWAGWELEHRKKRDASMEHMEFPFPYREGQKKLAATVYHTIREQKELFLMAPTGVGKTMSCVFPAVRAVGRGLGSRIFYLTAKNETLAAGSEAFSILRERGLVFRTVRITSKEKICPMNEPRCNPEDCPYARGHFDRINEAVYDLLQEAEYIDRTRILSFADARQVCPFELTLDAASWCDAILCDYNYVFDPDASLKRFFAAGSKGDYIFLIDEAHNLVERGREMYSAEVVKEHVLAAKRAAGRQNAALTKAMEKVNRILLALKHRCEEEPSGSALGKTYLRISFGEADPLIKEMLRLYAQLRTFYEESEDADRKEKLLDFYFETRSFLNAADALDENYLIWAGYGEEDTFFVKLLCANPAGRITEQIDKGRAAVFFSATLLPIAYYRRLLTTKEDPFAVYAPSPFDTGKRLLLIGRDVSTRYSDRGEDMYRRIAKYIASAAQTRTGNYLVFFPSYRLLKDVFRIYAEEFDSPEVNWIMQSSFMGDDDREIFLENFYEDPEKSLVGFCVMGGMFSEGIDLTGTKLIGAVIVGAGIPQVSAERDILRRYYDEVPGEDRAGDVSGSGSGYGRSGGEGFDYAYRYPGINKVEQAAGRVIRTSTDRGVILLLDDRLLTAPYRRLFPREWSTFDTCSADTVQEQLLHFWEQT